MVKRIQGKRWAVIVFDGPDTFNIIGAPFLARCDLWAMMTGRDVPYATVIDVAAVEATQMAKAGAYVDDTTVAELAKACGNSKPFTREVLRQQIAKGKGMISERMRAELDRKRISDSASELTTAKREAAALRRKLRAAERKVKELEDG